MENAGGKGLSLFGERGKDIAWEEVGTIGDLGDQSPGFGKAEPLLQCPSSRKDVSSCPI